MANDDRSPMQTNQVPLSDEQRQYGEEIGIGPSFLQLALVVVLVCALFMGPIAVLAQIDPGGPWRLMPLFALLVAVESVITRRWLDWPVRRRQRSAYLLAELIFILLLTPFFLWLTVGRAPFPASFVELLERPLAFFDLRLALFMLLAVFVWQRAHSWAGLFNQLAITVQEVRYHTSSTSERSADRSILLPQKNRAALLNTFVQGWIVGGMLLVIMTALVNFDLHGAYVSIAEPGEVRTLTRLGMKPEMLVALLLYFLGGLWLISQGRIVQLKGRWLADQSRRDPGLMAKWRGWALLLVIAIALLASFLPIGTTFPFYQILYAITSFLASIGANILYLIARLIYAIIYFIISLLEGSTAPPPPPDFGEILAPDQLSDLPPSGTPAFLAGAMFWLAIIVIAILATVYFLRDRGQNASLSTLLRRWRQLKHWLLNLGRDAVESVPRLSLPLRLRFRRLAAGQSRTSRFRFFRIGALPPREQVRFLYLSLVRQSGKRGLKRSPAETPQEFARSLKSHWPDNVQDFDALTAAFQAARYSQHDITQSRLDKTKDAWYRIRRALSGRSQGSST